MFDVNWYIVKYIINQSWPKLNYLRVNLKNGYNNKMRSKNVKILKQVDAHDRS